MAIDGLWTTVSKPGVPVYNVYKNPMERSPQDDREYRWIKLTNELEAVVVQDAKTDNAAVSMNVCLGYLSDPVCKMNNIKILTISKKELTSTLG